MSAAAAIERRKRKYVHRLWACRAKKDLYFSKKDKALKPRPKSAPLIHKSEWVFDAATNSAAS